MKIRSKLINLIIFGGTILILYVTLFPFDFILRGDDFFSVVQIRFDLTLVKLQTPIDVLRNILLFIPVGFGFTCLLQKQKKENKNLILIAVLIIGFGLSLTVELLQVLLPERDPSISDLLTNSLGAFLGYGVAYWWGDHFLGYFSMWVEKIKSRLSPRMLLGIFVGYATLFLLFSMWLQSMSRLTNWDPDFSLMLGNERTGDRPWQGRISELNISNIALSEIDITQILSGKEGFTFAKDNLLAAYRFSDDTNYQDKTGLLPELIWKGANPSVQSGAGILITPENWLITTDPVTYLNQKIRETSQITLETVVSSVSPYQEGPARIISISEDPFLRNFTLGQEGVDLAIRLRTPFTGENGQVPELRVPNVFEDSTPHHLIVVYDGSKLRIYVDDLGNSYDFGFVPEVIFFRYFLPVSEWLIHLNATVMWFYTLFYYTLIFVPLGLLLHSIMAVLSSFTIRLILTATGILLPAFVLEIGIAFVSKSLVRWENFLLSIAIMFTIVLLCKILLRRAIDEVSSY